MIVRHCVSRLTLAGDAPASKKGGVAPSTSTLLVRREQRAGRGGYTRGAASLRLVALGAENPCYPTSHGAFRESPQPQRLGALPSDRKALGLLKRRATDARHRGFFGGALVRLHRLDPQRRKSSIIPRSSSEPVSCSVWRTFLTAASKPPWRSRVSQSVSGMAWRRTAASGAACFRDWGAEATDHPREVIEAALAHLVRNRVKAAYARSGLFERRRVLMDDWSRYLAQGTGEDSER